jgi:ribosomal protein S18 acetylase RimI-like enzyme
MRLKITWENIYGSITGGPDPNLVSTDAINDLVAGAREAEKLYPAERWSLSWLGVSPKCQRTGIGRRLTQWGIDRSEEEGVPAALVSSTPGRTLYEKLGFKEIGRAVYDKAGNWQPVMLRPVKGNGEDAETGGE